MALSIDLLVIDTLYVSAALTDCEIIDMKGHKCGKVK